MCRIATALCLSLLFAASDVSSSGHPIVKWACFDTKGVHLPRYWRLVGSSRLHVEREIQLYEERAFSSGADSPWQQQRLEKYACRVDYLKDGLTQVLWYARYEPSYCRAKAKQLVRKLEANGLTCRAFDKSDTFYLDK